MKHTLKVTIFLISLFLVAQILGLIIINRYIESKEVVVTETGEEVVNITWKNAPSIAGVPVERPEIERPSYSILLIVGAIIAGTLLMLLLIRIRTPVLWKLWFFLAILICLTFAFGAFVGNRVAFVMALAFTLLKVFRPSVIIHNFTEVFIYGGLAAIFVPIEGLNIGTMFVILFLISVYDMYAVWKSKHMIKLAKFQSKSGMFAGMLIPYRLPKMKKLKKKGKKKAKIKHVKVKTAILGGGDVAFPLLFAGTALKKYGLFPSMVIPVFATIALGYLLWIGRKDKFYPAMPFLTVGCVIGFIAMLFFV